MPRSKADLPPYVKCHGVTLVPRKQFAVTSDRHGTGQRERRQDGCLPLRSRRAGAAQAITTGLASRRLPHQRLEHLSE